MFVALIAVGAFIRIPTPMVPITLQYLFTMLAGLFLGGKLGCLSVCIYIALGLLGLPVFTQGGGPGYIFQPSFGYIIGFAAGALATGTVAGKSPRPGFPRLLAANFIGLGNSHRPAAAAFLLHSYDSALGYSAVCGRRRPREAADPDSAFRKDLEI